MFHHLYALTLLVLIVLGPIPLGLFFNTCQPFKPSHPALTQWTLSSLTLWSLIQICLGLLLGSLHQFTLLPVLLLELILAALGLALFWASPQARGRLRALLTDSLRSPLQPSEMFVVGAIIFAAVVLLERIATQPFTNYDTLWFHGPIIARWYQTGSLSQLDPLGNWIIQHPDANGYPYHWHILGVFFLLPFGQDLLLTLPMLMAWSLLGLSTYLLSCQVGAERFYALAAAALVSTVPFVLNHVTTLHIDLPLAAIYTVSLYYLICYFKTRHGWHACLFLATTGLMAGIKTPGIIYAAFLIMLLLTAELRLTSKFVKTRSLLQQPLFWLGVALCLGLGSFWYIKNFLDAGLYTIQATAQATAQDAALILTNHSGSVAETPSKLNQILEKIAYLQSTTLTSRFNINQSSHWISFMSQAIVRLQLPVVVLLAQIGVLPVAQLKSSKTISRQVLLGLYFLLLSTFFLYWNTPYSAGGKVIPVTGFDPVVGFNMRYGFPVLGILGVVAAVSASQLKTNRALVTLTVLTSSLLGIISSTIFDKVRIQSLISTQYLQPSQLVNELSHTPGKTLDLLSKLLLNLGIADIGVYLILFTSGGGLLCLWIYRSRLRLTLNNLLQRLPGVGSLLLPGLAGLIVVTGVTAHWQQVRDQNRQMVYRGIDQVIEQAVGPTESLAYFASPQSYLFYGRNLDKSVIHLWPANNDFTAWMTKLKQANVKVVAVDHRRLGTSEAAYHYAYSQDLVEQTLTELSGPGGSLTPILGESRRKELTLYRLEP